MMFNKILIANRGEIACRIMDTARRMGVATVAVYSEADARALHVASCDEAWLIGPAQPRESYLRGDRILDVARPNVALYVGGMGARDKNFYNTIMQKYGYVDEAIANMVTGRW